nr:hypothetical protein GCM10020063_084500 [Dactylosporangium thailandense]
MIELQTGSVEEGVMERDVTRREESAGKSPEREDDAVKRLERDAEVPVRRHRRRDDPAVDER